MKNNSTCVHNKSLTKCVFGLAYSRSEY